MEYLKEALSNLIDNALKYSKETVEIRIASRREADFIRISFRDNGIGIPLSAQRTIFDKFERVLPRDDGSGEKKVSGFGLGLNYVMNVAREHGGYVSVESVQGRSMAATSAWRACRDGSASLRCRCLFRQLLIKQINY